MELEAQRSALSPVTLAALSGPAAGAAPAFHHPSVPLKYYYSKEVALLVTLLSICYSLILKSISFLPLLPPVGLAVEDDERSFVFLGFRHSRR